MAELSERMRALVQPHLAAIEPYDPNFTPTEVNLSANENTYDLPAGVRAAIDAALAATPLNRYPDPMSNELRDELAAWRGVPRDMVCVGNGGDELLFNFLLAFGGQGRTLLTCPPDFSEYAFFASLVQTSVDRVWRDERTFGIKRDELLDAAARADMVILTSPNNPTGDVIPLDLARKVCEVCPGMVMIDEAYGEFADEGTSAAALLGECDNLVVLHTLSKAFGAAGIRCGYVLAAPDVIEVFGAVRQIYSVNVLTQAAALAAVKARSAFAPVVAQVRSERERLHAELSALTAPLAPQAAVWAGQGNFLLMRVPDASAVRQRLRDDHSILVRDFSYAPGLADCLRITVGTPEENDRLLAALRVELARNPEEGGDTR